MSKTTILLGSASTRAFRCLWMLEELGLSYQHLPEAPQSDQVLQYNPLGKIPVLIEKTDNGTTFSVYESSAICTYLGDQHQQLVPPSGSQARAWHDQTLSVLTTELDAQGLWIHRKHDSMGHVFGDIPPAVAHARKYFHKTHRALIQQLLLDNHSGEYLMGSDFTIADIFYVHCLEWSKMIGWSDKWESNPAVMDYLKLCQGRPAYQRAKAIRKAEQRGEISNSKL